MSIKNTILSFAKQNITGLSACIPMLSTEDEKCPAVMEEDRQVSWPERQLSEAYRRARAKD